MRGRDTQASTGYRWKDKDPIIDAIRHVIDQSGHKISEIAAVANVANSTIYAMDKGKTRKPQHATARSIMEACGYQETWVNAERRIVVQYIRITGAPTFKITPVR